MSASSVILLRLGAPPCHCDGRRWLGWPGDRENLAHVRGQHFAIVGREPRKGPPSVPGNRQGLSQGPSPIREPDGSQLIAVALQLRRNDCYAMSRLGERQQG